MSSVTIFAAILFVVTYVLMFAFQKIRPYVAVLSAVIFVVVGSCLNSILAMTITAVPVSFSGSWLKARI